MIGSSNSYAIGLVHFRIGGGLKMVISLLALYLAALGTAAGLFYYYALSVPADAPPPKIPWDVVLTILLSVQAVVLLILGGMRASNSVRTDLSSSMIESHRLMPVPAWQAVLGYLFGSTGHATAFMALNFIITSIAAVIGGVALSRLWVSHGLLLGMAILVWSFATCGTFIYRNILLVVIGILVFSSCTRLIFIFYYLSPPFALIVRPFFNVNGLGFAVTAPMDWTYGVAMAAALGFSAILFGTAARMYRGTYRTNFSRELAIALVALWAIFTCVGIYHAERLGIGAMGPPINFRMRTGIEREMILAQVITAVLSTCVLGLIPIWSAIRNQRPNAGGRIYTVGTLVAVVAMTMVAAAGACRYDYFNPRFAMWISLSIAGAHVAVWYGLLRMLQNLRGLLATVLGVLIVVVIWLFPLIADAIRAATIRQPSGMGILSTFSPVGALLNAWNTEIGLRPMPGLIVQWLEAVAVLGLAFGLEWMRAQRAKPVLEPAGGK